jgi:hypothetical protein
MDRMSSDDAVLFSTDHGAVRWTPDGQLSLSLSGERWTVDPNEVATLHEGLESLAAQVYRCNCDCRWQLRVDDGATVVLGTDEVLRLHSLLRGALVMLELRDVLDAAAIDPSGVTDDGPRPVSEA